MGERCYGKRAAGLDRDGVGSLHTWTPMSLILTLTRTIAVWVVSPPPYPYFEQGATKALEDAALDFCYCIFHMMQAVDRWLKANHVDQPTRQAVLDAVRPLVSAKTRSAFLKEEAEFLASPVVQQVKGLKAYYMENWGGSKADRYVSANAVR